MLSSLFRITFTSVLYGHKKHFDLQLQEATELSILSHSEPSYSPIEHRMKTPCGTLPVFVLITHTEKPQCNKTFSINTQEMHKLQRTCLAGGGSCTTGSRVMNFLSLTMLRTSYSTHISVRALLKLFLTESQGQRDG